MPPECLFECVRVLAAPERCPPQKRHLSKRAKLAKQTRFRHRRETVNGFRETVNGFRETVNGFRETVNGKKANESIDRFPESINRWSRSPGARKPLQGDTALARKRFDFEVFGHEAVGWGKPFLY